MQLRIYRFIVFSDAVIFSRSQQYEINNAGIIAIFTISAMALIFMVIDIDIANMDFYLKMSQ